VKQQDTYHSSWLFDKKNSSYQHMRKQNQQVPKPLVCPTILFNLFLTSASEEINAPVML